ncbi:SAM-dependent methyltransferase [Helicobacter sp. T3_23-1056]
MLNIDFANDLEKDFGISFGQYMQEWLYGASGYYSRAKSGDEKVGKEGDFYTAVSVSRFFGGAIAKHIISLLESSELDLPLIVVEFGAHSGRLLNDIIEFLEALSEGVLEQARFYTIEPLASLRDLQAQNPRITPLQDINALQDLLSQESKNASKLSAFMLSNELFDAFACEVVWDNKLGFVKTHNDCATHTAQIIWHSNEEIKKEIQKLESKINLQDFTNKDFMAREFMTKDFTKQDFIAQDFVKQDFAQAGQLWLKSKIEHLQKMLCQKQILGIKNGEIAVGLEDFIKSVCSFANAKSLIKSWRFLSFDYGNLQEKKAGQKTEQNIGQNHITLRGYKSHKLLSFEEICADLDGLFGVSDLTYEVDFLQIIALFEKFGAKVHKKSRLNVALVDFGIDRLLQDFFVFCQSVENQKSAKPHNQQKLQNPQNLQNPQSPQNAQNPNTQNLQNKNMQLYQQESLKVRELLSPNGMGERFICVEFGNKT